MFILIVILLFALAPFLILLAFIAWDRHRLTNENVKPMSRDLLRNGWTPKPTASAPIFIGIALMFATLGAYEWFYPHHPPFRGRLSWAYEAAYAYFGLQGQAYVFLAIAASFVVASIMTRKVES